jgi:amino acid permease
MAWIAGITAIALLFRFQWQMWFVVPLLFAALILAVGHLGRSERNASLWLFNHRSIGSCGSTPQAMGSAAWR